MQRQCGLWLAVVALWLGLALASPGEALSQQPERWPAAKLLPYRRGAHTVIHDAARGRLILFGGWNGQAYLNDVWALDLSPASEAWVRLDPDGTAPPPRAFAAAIYDAAAGRMILFGGRGYAGHLNDLWALDLTPGHEAWQRLETGEVTPPARHGHSAIYDPGGGRLLVFGGVGKGTLLADLWALDLTPGSEAWQPLAAGGPWPDPRAFSTAIADAANNRLILFGGRGMGGLLGDAWALDLSPGAETWSLLAPGGSPPPPRQFHSAAYDAGRGRMLIFGGLGSGGFLADLWALDLTPGGEAWTALPAGPETEAPRGATVAPPAMAWHTTLVDTLADRLVLLGGFGPPEAVSIRQWLLDLVGDGWQDFQPVEPALSPNVSASLQVEDATPGVVVNKLVNAYADVVVSLASDSLTHAQGITVTLTVPGNVLGAPIACLRPDAAGPCTPVPAYSLGEGRYAVYNLALPGFATNWAGQVRFRFYIIQVPAEPLVSLDARATFAGGEQRDANGALRVCSHVDALLVTNRTGLFERYDDDEVRLLLARLYELAGGAQDGAPAAAVYYAERYVPALATWDHGAVDYASEATANHVANLVDIYIEDWAARAGSPTYLLLVGDDDVLPLYRKASFGDELNHPWVGNNYYPSNQIVYNDYYLSDNPYGDLDGGWERGEVELATGRIVGGTAADMLTLVDNGQAGPAPDSGRAIVASVMDEYCEPAGGDCTRTYRDAILPGPGNDLVDALRDDWGLDVRNDTEPPVTIETLDWDLDDLMPSLQAGFVAFQSMSHAENNVLCFTPDCLMAGGDLTPSRVLSLMNAPEPLAEHRPFFYLAGCRTGLSVGRYWDETLVWSLAHSGASGMVASTGLAYGAIDEDVATTAEALANRFWLRAIEDGRPQEALGRVLRDARRDLDSGLAWTNTELKTAQTHTLFGLPWLMLPEGATTRQEGASPPPAGLEGDLDLTLGRGRVAHSYVATATVDASDWSLSAVAGFDLVQVAGLALSYHDGGPVVPVANLRLPLPPGASVLAVTATLSQELDLGLLEIPTLQESPDYLGAPPGVYTATDSTLGIYPPQPYHLHWIPQGAWKLARISTTPLRYDTAGRQATLYRRIDVTVTYTTPLPVAAIELRSDRLRYLPGETVTAWAWLRNVTPYEQVVTPTLLLLDPLGRVGAAHVGAPVALPAGQLSVVPLQVDAAVDEGTYRLRFAAWQSGHVVAALEREVLVSAGRVAALAGPDVLLPGGSGQFQVTLANDAAQAAMAVVHLAVLDAAGQVVSDLAPQATILPAQGTAAVSFEWDAAGRPGGSYTVVARAVGGATIRGITSRQLRIGSSIYLPLLLRGG